MVKFGVGLIHEENYNMKAAEISFRDVYHRVCFVKAGKNYMMSL